jgi:diguanylate cyclase
VDRLPALITPFGPLGHLVLQVHDLTIRGKHPEALQAADENEWIARAFGDRRSARMMRHARSYALDAMSRLDEALTIMEDLAGQTGPETGPRPTDAKVIADAAELLIKRGRMEEGLHYLARAMAVLEHAVRGPRYLSAMSSLCEAAKAAELFELADECMRVSNSSFDDELYREAGEIQHAELLLEWALRLEQLGRAEEAYRLFMRSVALLRPWIGREEDDRLGTALIAVALAKTGGYAEALGLVEALLLPLRAAGQWHEARLLHLAHGLVRAAAGDFGAARREFTAADELAELPTQRLVYRYELALVAAAERPGQATQGLLATVRGQVEQLWRLRNDRRMMLQQARRRVELEAARTRADREATSDALTGLGNRRLFDRRIASAAGTGALVLIDVDRFKSINDDFSHGVGDRVLREIAAVLRAHCRHDEVAVRFGGDEFALFLNVDVRSAARVAERIRQVVLARDWSDLAVGLRVTLSMGLAAYADGMTGRELYDRADRHLYAAKREGRNRLAA